MPAALPWLYKTAGNGPLPSGLYKTPCSVRLPLGNVTTPAAGEAKANAVIIRSNQQDRDMAGDFTPLNSRVNHKKKAPRSAAPVFGPFVTSLSLLCTRRAAA